MKLVKKLWNKYYDYIVIAFVYGVLHFFMHTDYWDDITTSKVLKDYQYDIVHYLHVIWETWSSTLFLHGIEAIIGSFPNYVWKILDVLMIEIIYHFMKKLVNLLTPVFSDNTARLWILLFFFNFPYSLLATAGWMTTTIAYTWTFAALFYSLYIFFFVSKGEQIALKSYIFFGVAVMFAANCNLLSISMFTIFLCIYVTCSTKSRAFKILFYEGAIETVINIVLFIAAPGNRVRMIEDARFHDTAELLDMSIGGHLRMGITSTFYHFVSIPNIILFTFCLVLVICIFCKTKDVKLRAVSCTPLLLDILWTGYIFLAYTIPNRTLTYIYPDASFQICPKGEQYLAIISALLIVFISCWLLAYLTNFTYLSWILVGSIFIVGLFPNVAIGFTTTVSASIIRVVTFFYFSLMFCTCVLVGVQNMLKMKACRYILILGGMLGGCLNILQVIRHIIIYG